MKSWTNLPKNRKHLVPAFQKRCTCVHDNQTNQSSSRTDYTKGERERRVRLEYKNIKGGVLLLLITVRILLCYLLQGIYLELGSFTILFHILDYLQGHARITKRKMMLADDLSLCSIFKVLPFHVFDLDHPPESTFAQCSHDLIWNVSKKENCSLTHGRYKFKYS